MVPWWKRIVYSIVSVLFADVVALLVLVVTDIISHPVHARGFTSLDSLLGVLLDFCFVIVFSAPGWLLALPFVIYLRSLDGRRVWVCALVGALIGPVLMYGFAVYVGLRSGVRHWPVRFDTNAMVVSVVATMLYILLIKRTKRVAQAELVAR